jgi:hypothetical protein
MIGAIHVVAEEDHAAARAGLIVRIAVCAVTIS